jgi:signal transduction histidine kinase/DNA-binding response OmpR family regulator
MLMLIILGILTSCDSHELRLTDSHPARLSAMSWSNSTHAMQLDGRGFLWIGTDRGVQVFDGSNYRLFSHDGSDTTTLRSDDVVDIFRDRADSMWVVTKDGIDRYEGNSGFHHFSTNSLWAAPSCMTQTEDGSILALFGGDLCVLSGNTFRRCCQISKEIPNNRSSIYACGGGRLLVSLETGIYVVDRSLHHVKPLAIPSSIGNVTCADKDNVYVLSFAKGITILDRHTLHVRYQSGQAMPIVPDEAAVWQEHLFFSGHDGLYSMDLITHQINPQPTAVQQFLSPAFITKMYVTPENVLYIGYNKGLAVKAIHSLSALSEQLRSDSIYEVFQRHSVVSVTQDGKGNIFGALDNDSIFYLSDKEGIRMLSLGLFIDIHSQMHVSEVFFSAGYFWVMTTSALFAITYDNDFHMAQYYDFGFNNSSASGSGAPFDNGLVVNIGKALVVFDAVHKGPLADETGLAANHRPVVYRRGNFNIRTVPLIENRINAGAPIVSLGGREVMALPYNRQPWVIGLDKGTMRPSRLHVPGAFICSARLGNHTFIGTDNGMFVYDSAMHQLTNISEMGHRPVNNVVVSERGLLATCKGDILSFDLTTRRIDTLWTDSPSDDFQPHTLAMGYGNNLFAATRKGFRSYTVRDRASRGVRPLLLVESIDAGMTNDAHRSCLLFGADSTTTVVLRHNENTFKIAFSARGADDLSSNYTYRYRLAGYDEGWRYDDAGGEVEYTKVKPGSYRFEIMCIDRERPWIKAYKSVDIRILPHPLLSKVAIVIYILFVLAVLFVVNRLYIRMRMIRIHADTAAKEKDREQHINRMNMDFFTNISHEFRNPITMIAGPVNILRHAPELSKQSGNMVRLISQSAGILQKLVNQMLDFNLLEGDAMRLSVRRIDVAAIVTAYSHHYEVSAAEKGIHIINIGTNEPRVIFADEDKVIKVFDNLMSNALKHTAQNGTITVRMVAEGKMLRLSVENTGSHIPEHSLSTIFERYYQASDDVSGWGVGLGLHYVGSLVTLHHGTITAANTPEGVAFTFSLPLDDVYTEEEKKARGEKTDILFHDDDIVRPRRLDDVTTTKEHTLLVVEKDVNTAYFLRRIFEDSYHVINRYDAESALSDIASLHPDAIISCIMLDGMSGLDFCRELHADEQFRDIPFIFLTTCDGGDKQAEGIRAGADAYITKPFGPEYLREVVAKLLASADKYKAMQTKLPQQAVKLQEGLSTKDKEMLRTIRKFMKDNISDGDLDTEKLSRKLLLSRTKLYEKIKQLTGKTPNELFRTYKLGYAAQLLKEGKLNVSEVAERAGFSSVAFFSRTFKNYYGVSPKNYD